MLSHDEIASELSRNLDKSRVKEPPKGKYGQYIEGWWAIAEANNIFGWDGWSYRIDGMTQTNCDLMDKTTYNGAEYKQWEIGYMAIVTVTVGETSRQGTGFGQGHSKQKGDAFESATKEAETDALKRAFRSFGWRFGLALYDKTKANVSDVKAAEKLEIDVTDDIEIVKTKTDAAELESYFKAVRASTPAVASHPDFIAACKAQKAAITEGTQNET